MTITQVTREFKNDPGCTYTVEQAEIEVTIGGVTKTVVIERLSPSHNWLLAIGFPRHEIIVRFPTGSKEHKVCNYYAHQRNGKWVLSASGFRNSNRMTVVRWAEDSDTGSGWTR
jgi:hypothetical protein